MNERYLFRAKSIVNGEWVEGYYAVAMNFRGIEQHNILIPDNSIGYFKWEVVKPSTICQCTGLKDKNGKLIWENDIIKCKGIITAVSWNTRYASWVLTRKGWMYSHFFGESQDPEECEVIGNIFDNPELMEQEE